MGSNKHSSSSLTIAATAAVATWTTASLTAWLVRKLRKQRYTRREIDVASNGGLLPQTNNIVEALEYRATSPNSKSSLALEGADGTRYTWKDYRNQVRSFGLSLQQRHPTQQEQNNGISSKGIAVHAFNRPEWFFAALGAMSSGWSVSGIYLTNTYEQAKHILITSNVHVLVLEGMSLLETTYKTVIEDFPNITVVLLDGTNGEQNSAFKGRVVSYESFVKPNLRPEQEQSIPIVPIKDDDVACLVYTSGTTGNPKAVELTHANVRSVVSNMHARIPLNESSIFVSYLPLSHIAAMGIDIFSPIYCGGSMHFADADALRGTLKDTLVRVRPTLFFGVPRVWEKMATAFQTAAQKSYEKPGSGKVLKTIGSIAKSVGALWYSSETPEFVRCSLVLPFGFFKLLAFRKVRRASGLDRAEFLYTGAAPLPTEVLKYFRSLDMPVLEVFGMSESCGVIAVCGPNDTSRPIGACGQVLPNGNLQIGSDGEIVYKGDNVMNGYKGLPEATSKSINQKTFQLHTGDLGMVDADGYLYVTGRKKDLIITAGGENIAPTPIEETFASLLNGSAGHVVLIGDQRKFLTILIAPPEGADVDISSIDVEVAIKTYNTSYAKSRAQRVQKAHVINDAFTVASGELTPTLKLKRNIVVAKYKKEIDAMYSDGASNLLGYSSMNIDQPELS